MMHRSRVGLGVMGLCLGMAALAQAVDEAAPAAAPAAPAAAPRVVRKKAAPVKVSTTQLFTTLGTLEAKIDAIQKSLLTMPKQAGAPTVQMPGPGEGAEARSMMQAFYNFGSYRKQAENKRLASSVIRDMTMLGGSILAIQGWESSRDRWAPTPTNQIQFSINGMGQLVQTGWYRHVPLNFKHLTPYYTSLTFGVSTVVVGYLVSEFINWSASSSEKMADAALMHPLESQPQTAP